MNAIRCVFVMLALAAAGLLGGCYSVEVNPPPHRYDASAPPVDTRADADILRESRHLREQLVKLEKDYGGWQAAVRKREADKDALERHRDDLKKDRDRWKKAAKRDD